ncbi:MAG TPA: hypothetical protein VMT76_18315 [Puia sp.]|nr:hypothetical protein [Puia sp.]
MKKLFFFFCVAIIWQGLYAQDLTGIWRGHFQSNSSFQKMPIYDDRYKIEVQIAQKGNRFDGVTYSYKSTVFYAKASAEGTINSSSQKVFFRELKLLEVRMTDGGQVYAMDYFLKYSKLGNEEFLEGTYISYNIKDSSRGEKGTVFLHRVVTSDFYKEPFVKKREEEIAREKHSAPATRTDSSVAKKSISTKTSSKKTIPANKSDNSVAKKNIVPQKNNPGHNLPKPAPKPVIVKADVAKQNTTTVMVDSSHKIERKTAPDLVLPKVLTSRKNELVKTISVTTNEVELRVYDDGTIDHDTVSIFVDNRNVINHAMLTDKPIIVKLHLDDDNNYHEVVMVAENEGEIPPNTSLMVVKAGDKEYEVRIVSTEQKNATVVFKFEKK